MSDDTTTTTDAPTDAPSGPETGQDGPDESQTAPDGAEGQQDEAFPRKVVEDLRREAAGHRTRAADRDVLAQRLQRALVAADGRLVADDVLPFQDAHITSEDALRSAIDDLLAARPYLAAQPKRPQGDVGQGRKPEPPPTTWGSLLRGEG